MASELTKPQSHMLRWLYSQPGHGGFVEGGRNLAVARALVSRGLVTEDRRFFTLRPLTTAALAPVNGETTNE